MSQPDIDLEENLNELRAVSHRINTGLDQVISVLEDMARDGTRLVAVNEPAPADVDDDHPDPEMPEIIETIRTRIRDIAALGSVFEEKITQHATELVEIKTQLEETKLNASLDPLTKIANRGRFEEVLESMLDNIDNYESGLSVLLADIDKFKSINDTLGHNVGDQVLKLVAKTFTDNVRGADLVARWGGDEFAAILPNTNGREAQSVSENVRHALSSKNVVNKLSGEKIGKITLSIGGAAYQQADTMLRIMERADKALYQAKNSGRNKVVINRSKG